MEPPHPIQLTKIKQESMEQKVVAKFLTGKGYKLFKNEAAYPVRYNNLWQKKTKSKSACETNGALRINVIEIALLDFPASFEVKLVAEKNNKWWNLCCYSLKAEDLEIELPNIEETLIRLFESITP